MICSDHQLLLGKRGREMHESLHSANCLEEIAVNGKTIHSVSCTPNVVYLISNMFFEFGR
jgi:hypothetical protein